MIKNKFKIKYLIGLFSIFFVLFFPNFVLADTCDQNNCDMNQYDPVGKNTTIEDMIFKVLNWLKNISAPLAILMIVVAGFIYLTSFGSERIGMAKNMIVGALFGIAVVFLASSILIEIVLFAGGDRKEIPLDEYTPLKDIVENTIDLLAGFIGILSVLALVISGFMWMTSGGNSNQIGQAKNIFQYAIIGMVIAIASYSIIQLIGSFF